MIAGVLLAAGASSRMGRDKALALTGGESYLVRGVRNLWAACDQVVVVLGAHHAEIQRSVEAEFTALIERRALDRDFQPVPGLGGRAHGREVHFVRNPAWRRGMLSSARVGLSAAIGLGPGAVLVHPVDHPDVSKAAFLLLALRMHGALAALPRRERRSEASAIVPRHRRRRGHPVALTAALAQAIVSDRDADDLSDAIRRNARIVAYLDIAEPGVIRNRNRPRD